MLGALSFLPFSKLCPILLNWSGSEIVKVSKRPKHMNLSPGFAMGYISFSTRKRRVKETSR